MSCAPFTVDPDVRAARTPPGAFYGDAALHAAMIERAFAPSWQPLLDSEPLPLWGQAPTTLLPGSLNEPLLRVRDAGGERVMSNVCTHRGAVLVDAARRGKRIACPYHGRCYSLDGAVLAAPGFEGRIEGLPALPTVSSVKRGPIWWVALEPGDSVGPALDILDSAAPGLPWERAEARADLAQDYEIPVHWSLYVENYLEGLHIPYVHPGLAAAVDRASYTTEMVPGGVLQTAWPRGEGPRLLGGQAALYLWLFPNVMVNVYPWGVSLNVVLPRSTGACRVAFRSFVWASEHLGTGAGAGLDAVELEDEAVVARVRAGIGARLYDRGHYADPAEAGVHRFHRLLAHALWPAGL